MANAADGVKRAVIDIFDARKHQLYVLAQDYAKQCLDEFQDQQKTGAGIIGKYWHNRTAQASDKMFSEAYTEDYLVAWFLSHVMPYGVYLELCNDRKYEAIRPLVEKWGMKFIAAARALYS